MTDLNYTQTVDHLEVTYWKLESIQKNVFGVYTKLRFRGYASESGFEAAPSSPTITKDFTLKYLSGTDVEILEALQTKIDTPVTVENISITEPLE